MKTILVLIFFAFTLFCGAFSYAQSDEKKSVITKTANKAQKRQAPLIIRSQVKGSQEQPNVMYILPWQGIDNPIIIEGKSKQIVLPKFQPINPKNFKSQVTLFHQQNKNN
jgi:hypothetical protein